MEGEETERREEKKEKGEEKTKKGGCFQSNMFIVKHNLET